MPLLAVLYSQDCFLVHKLTKDLFSDLKYQITLYKTHVGVEHLIFKNNNIKYSFIECWTWFSIHLFDLIFNLILHFFYFFIVYWRVVEWDRGKRCSQISRLERLANNIIFYIYIKKEEEMGLAWNPYLTKNNCRLF